MERFSIHRQAAVLIAICLFDLVSTVWVVNTGRGDEANPLMAFFLAQGVMAFVAAKLCMVAAPVATLEWARPKRPKFVHRAYYAAFAGYLGFYAIGVAKANHVPSPSVVRAHLEPERVEVWNNIRARINAKNAARSQTTSVKSSEEISATQARQVVYVPSVHRQGLPMPQVAPAPNAMLAREKSNLPVAVPMVNPDFPRQEALPVTLAEVPVPTAVLAN